MRKITALGLMVAALLSIMAAEALAHRVVLFAWIEGDTVFTQSKFPGGARVSEGGVSVLDETGREILSGKTDRQGEFSFPLTSLLQSPSALKIVLHAGMGHQASWELSREEVGQAMGVIPEEPVDVSPPDEARPESIAPQAVEGSARQETPSIANEADIRKIVEEAIDRKLSPIMDMLVSIREEMTVGLDDVVAGLGYIFGLTGLLAWLKARGKK